MSAGNLLVVDDDQNLIELIALKLKAEGYEVTTAGTGQEAVQAAKAAIFDLCIVDLRLADQDGISLMRELHSINPGMRTTYRSWWRKQQWERTSTWLFSAKTSACPLQ